MSRHEIATRRCTGRRMAARIAVVLIFFIQGSYSMNLMSHGSKPSAYMNDHSGVAVDCSLVDTNEGA